VHGAWNYNRISKVILYSFYKNITLYIIELWFAIYNYWSGQVIYERWTIGLYNMLFTSAPPVAFGLFDRSCSAATREQFPSLYHASQRSEAFNHREFWKWIVTAIYHSVLLFWLPTAAFQTGVGWSAGRSDGYLVLGNTVYTLVVVTTCLKAGLEMDAWTWFSHGSIWGSIALWFFFLLVYSHAWPWQKLVASNMPAMFELLVSSPLFWLSLLLVPTVTLLYDLAARAVRATVWTSESDRIRIAEVMEGDVAVYVEGGAGPPPTESSKLLRNVRKRLRGNGTRQRREAADTVELDLQRGYAFSQEEAGAVSQGEFIRRYDTTARSRSSLPRVTAASSPESVSSSLPPNVPGRVV